MSIECACGCGGIPPVARKTRVAKGHVKGQRCRYLPGHRGGRTLGYVVEDRGYKTPCHIAGGALYDGYARVTVNGKRMAAHRVAFEREHGPIPERLEPDHLCRQRACVRVDHIEVVTHAENGRRGASATLSAAAVADIRRLLAVGDLSQEAIARQFGVQQAAVSKIKLGRTWAGVV